MLFGLVVVFARYVELHPDSLWTCRIYTFILVGNLRLDNIFLSDGLDYGAAVSRVVLPPVAFVLLPYLSFKEEIRRRES